MESPALAPQTISYQIPRDVLIRLLYRRTFFRPRRFRSVILFLAAAALFYIAGPEYRYLTYIFVGVIFILPWAWHRAVVRTIDQTPWYADQKTVTFSPAGLTAVGHNYTSELAWTYFKAFSEDTSYFYLHLSNTGFDSVLPKAVFTAQQQEEFRRYARILNDPGVRK